SRWRSWKPPRAGSPASGSRCGSRSALRAAKSFSPGPGSISRRGAPAFPRSMAWRSCVPPKARCRGSPTSRGGQSGRFGPGQAGPLLETRRTPSTMPSTIWRCWHSRGSLIHEVQYELLRELSEAGELPIRDLSAVQQRLEAVVDRVARRWEDDLAPAIDRVWKDCIAGVKIDLREWLRRMSEEPGW